MVGLLALTLLVGQPTSDFPQARAVAATVRVINVRGEGVGSGVFIGRKEPFAFVLTALHVVDKADRPIVEAFAGDIVHRSETADVLVRQRDIDIALIRVPASAFPNVFLPLANHADLVRTGSFAALTVGCSNGETPTGLFDDVLSRRLVRRSFDANRLFWETKQVPVSGRSGGPLVDRTGRVIGICSGTQEGRGYYTYADEIHAVLKREGFGWLARTNESLPTTEKILEK